MRVRSRGRTPSPRSSSPKACGSHPVRRPPGTPGSAVPRLLLADRCKDMPNRNHPRPLIAPLINNIIMKPLISACLLAALSATAHADPSSPPAEPAKPAANPAEPAAEPAKPALNPLKAAKARADVTTSEKYRRILEAYQIEMDYGRTLEAYEGVIAEADANKTVQFVRLGRIALMYQTLDGRETGYWDQVARKWVVDDSYAHDVKEALRVAKKQGAPDLLMLPVPAPQASEVSS